MYVRPYPDVNSGRWQVSTSGGRVHYGRAMDASCSLLDAERWMMATRVRTNAGFGVGAATRLFDTHPLSPYRGSDETSTCHLTVRDS